MAGGSGNYVEECEKCDELDVIPTTSRRWRAATELERFALETTDVDRYEGGDGDDANVDEEEVASQAKDGSTQNVED